MVLATVPYDIAFGHDGRKYDVHIEKLSVPQCTNCGAIAIDDTAGKQIDDEFRRVAKLLAPEEIREGRIGVGYANQQEFADCLGLSVSTVSRWENGIQIQQSFCDGILRAFFNCPEFRRIMAVQHGLSPKETLKFSSADITPIHNLSPAGS
jgi:DNA-binding transcriptional regulator YiaG